MSPEEKKKTEEKIINAAEEIFVNEGFSGTRMQTIADKAGINKALLHYYYRSKQKLFYAVFNRLAPRIFSSILIVLKQDLPLLEKIRKFVYAYIDEISSKNKHIPLFIISELERNPDMIAEVMNNTFKSMEFNPVRHFEKEVNEEIAAGNIHPINHKHLFVNIISLSVFPFIGRPIIMKVGEFDNDEYDKFLQDRKKHVADFIINSIKSEKQV
ncbi:MAG: TetR/AcrR family transcriptional regulator [Fidelibacterota bacterium]